MKLPKDIERDLRAVEQDYAARDVQQAGLPRLRSLRASIELELQRYRTVLREYLKGGAMTGSDRDLFESRFKALLSEDKK